MYYRSNPVTTNAKRLSNLELGRRLHFEFLQYASDLITIIENKTIVKPRSMGNNFNYQWKIPRSSSK